MTHPTVLVVDDDRDVRSFLCDLLRDEGYTTIGLEDGVIAWDWLHTTESPPQLILLDLMMPIMSGWEFRQRQVSEPHLAVIPVIVISAIADRTTTLRLDVAATLPKPVPIDDLLDLVSKYTASAA